MSIHHEQLDQNEHSSGFNRSSRKLNGRAHRPLGDAHDLLRLYHAVANGCDGVLMLVPISGKVYPQRFSIGDVEGMAAEAVARGEHANVYFAPAVIRKDIERGQRGKAADIVAQLGLVIDDDHDTGRPAIMPPIQPTAVVETCRFPTLNRHIHFVLNRPMLPAEAAALAELLHRKCGGDSGTKDTAHVWRVPGMLNHPTATKLNRGRPKEPQPVKLVSGTMQPVDPRDLRQALESMPDVKPASPKPNGHADETSINGETETDPAKLIKKLPRKVVERIRSEPEPGTRSEHCFGVMCRLFEKGLLNAQVAAVANDPSAIFARKFRDRGDLHAEIARARVRWAMAGKGREARADNDLARMNERYAVVKVGGKTRVMSLEKDARRGALIPVYSTFRDFQDFENKYRVEVVNSDGEVEKVGRGTWWIRQPARAQYDAVVFDPGGPPDPSRFNLWRGFGVEPVAGDCSHYLAHITDIICSRNDEHATYLLNYLAWGAQNPGKRPEVAVVLQGEEGVGKGTMVHPYDGLFGAHYQHVSQPGHLTGHFNAHLQQCRVLFADEALFAGDRRHDGVMKALITEPEIKIEPKGVDPFTVPNRLMIFMASNNEWVIPAGKDARRYLVLQVSDAKKQDYAHFEAITKELENGGREALLHWLLHQDLSDFNIRAVPITAALADQKARSRRGVDLLVELLADDGVLPAALQKYPHIALTSGQDMGEGFWPRARVLVPDLKHQSSRVIGNTLKETWGCKPWESHGRSGLAFPPLKELREMFDKRHGPQKWGHREEWGHNASDDAEPT